ncbi:MAG: hypothetical protein ACP5P3_07310 [Ignavibacteria bacterium]
MYISKHFLYYLIVLIPTVLYFAGCVAPVEQERPEDILIDSVQFSILDSIQKLSYLEDRKLSNGDLIFKYARLEQKNSMYAKDSDSTILYWLKNKPLYLKGQTKCNIFAINTLYRAGFKYPNVNVRTKDLMDEDLFNDIFPVIRVRKPEDLEKGDLIVWYGHVILYHSFQIIKNDIYALAMWAGTTKKDNGKNVINNVIFGKYPLSGNFIVRRPIKMNN